MQTVAFSIFVLVIVDLLVYVWTPHKERIAWPWWRYLPGGAIVAYLTKRDGAR